MGEVPLYAEQIHPLLSGKEPGRTKTVKLKSEAARGAEAGGGAHGWHALQGCLAH